MIAKCHFCKKDYQRPLQGGRAFYCSVLCRFKDKTKEVNGCWEWVGHKNNDGYGTMQFGKRSLKAHRVSYELFKGKIPLKIEVCHNCDNPSCVNPDHLFLGTHSENMGDMAQKMRRKKKTKLTPEKVLEIRKLLKEKEMSQYEIASKFGVTQGNIWCISKNQIWKHLKN